MTHLAETGLERATAASLIGWIDDPLRSVQQRAWTFQPLHDITGVSNGSDVTAWRSWCHT